MRRVEPTKAITTATSSAVFASSCPASIILRHPSSSAPIVSPGPAPPAFSTSRPRRKPVHQLDSRKKGIRRRT
ncbi:hypothetical protein TgHK011_004679 [Trichoderma gracile]|nr:hypothetical protein TgHK011_004679 [Trichoderma gracile]